MSLFQYTNVWFSILFYRSSPHFIQKAISQSRLKKMVNFARKKSSYYQNKIPESWKTLNDIPFLSKDEMMLHFDEIVTDPRISLEEVLKQYEESPDNARYLDDYTIALTSGSTGSPATIIIDKTFLNRDNMSGTGRFKMPIAFIGVTPDYGISGEHINGSGRNSAFIRKRVRNFSISMGPEELVRQLNEFQPKTISGFTTVIDTVADEVFKGNLKISPERVFLTGEYASPANRNRISKAFPSAEVHAFYGCTEGGAVAFECKYNHLHVNEDLVLLEPLNENNEPIGFEQRSAKIALTNLSNKVQPIIRYVVDDRTVFHKDCPCGNRSPWFEIEGRTHDTLFFEKENGETVKVPSLEILDALDIASLCNMRYFSRFQIILHKGNHLEVRLDLFDEVSPQEAMEAINIEFEKLFDQYKINADSYFSPTPPEMTSRGKINRIMMEKE